MGLSIEPGDSIHTKRMKRVGVTVQVLIICCTLVGMLWAGAQDFVTLFGGVVTKPELEQHNESKLSHPPLSSVDADLAQRLHELKQELAAQQKANEELGAQLVYVLAYSSETRSGSLKKAAAQFYRNEYKLMIARGVPVQDAIEEALEVPWGHSLRR